MIEFPGVYLFGVWAVGMAALLIIGIIHIYHAVRFGHFSFTSLFSTTLFISGVVVILWVTYGLVGPTAWTKPVQWQVPTISIPGTSSR